MGAKMAPAKSSLARKSAGLLVMFALLLGGSTAHAGDGAATAKTLPGAAMLVAHINLERLRSSPLYKELWQQVTSKNAKDLAELKTKFGIDLEKDIKGITFFVPPEIESEVFAVVLEGDFNEDKMVAGIRAEDPKVATADYAGQKYYTGDKNGALAFMGNQVIVAHPTALKQIIDAKGGKSNLASNAPLAALVNQAHKGGDVWFAAVLSGKIAQEASKGLAAQIPGAEIKTLSGSLDVAKGLGLKLLIGTNSAATASKIVGELQKGLEEAKKQPGPGAMFGNLLSGLKLTAVGAAVNLDLTMTEPQIAMVKGMLGAMTGMGGGGAAPAMPAPTPPLAPALPTKSAQ